MNVVPLKPVESAPVVQEEPAQASVYEPKNDRERNSLVKQHERRKKAKLVPRLKVTERNGNSQIDVDHSNPATGFTLLMEAVGSSNADFAYGLLKQVANIASVGIGRKVDEDNSNFVLSVIAGIEPRDQIEALLATQMAAVHLATMTFSRRLAHVETIPQQDAAEKAFNKLARTFAVQVEALKRYRSKGEQRVIVERVTVNQGGQAIVGNVAHGEG